MQDKYKIVLIGKDDAWYPDRDLLCGEVGTATSIIKNPGNWCYCVFLPDNEKMIEKLLKRHPLEDDCLLFYKVLLKKLK